MTAPMPPPTPGGYGDARVDTEAERPWYKKKRWWIVGALVVIVAIAAAVGGGAKKDDTTGRVDSGATVAPTTTDKATTSEVASTTTSTKAPAETTTAPPPTTEAPTTTKPAPKPIVHTGNGAVKTDPFDLAAGTYAVHYKFDGGCFYGPIIKSTDPGSTEYLEAGSGTGPIEGDTNLYGVEGGQYYVDMNTGPAPDCAWTLTLTPKG